MNIYVESGFILTLALQQEDRTAAEQILRLAGLRRITLKVPAFSLSEPFASVQYRANSRNRLIDELRREARELGRTRPHERMAAELGQHIIQMSQVLQTQMDAMQAVVLEVSRTCDLLQLDATVLTRAASYRDAYKLRLPDAIVLASIILDLERDESPEGALFISQNVKDFEDPSIGEALERLHCKYLADFTNAVRLIERPDA